MNAKRRERRSSAVPIDEKLRACILRAMGTTAKNTQGELADQLGINRDTVSRWLHGNGPMALRHYIRLHGYATDHKIDCITLGHEVCGGEQMQ